MAKKPKIEILNRKASFNYHADTKYTAGIMLLGTEVKSIRAGNVNMGDAYAVTDSGELWLKNLHISPFAQGSFGQHEPLRDRKLLLNRKELKKIAVALKNVGIAAFPIRLFEDEKGLFKLELGVGPGKKTHDKREDLKTKDVEREMARFKH
ncbi:MAG: SsrA-binding protein SmpB [Sphingomonadales bacterium]|nr:SsrA-binding protein SmpB [Sphingomonadales bacterium]